MNVQDVPRSSDFLSIEDTSKETKIAKCLDLELHLIKIHQSSPHSTADNFFRPPESSSLDTGCALTTILLPPITNRFPILLRATALFCNRGYVDVICISVQSGSMKTSFFPWRGFLPRSASATTPFTEIQQRFFLPSLRRAIKR